MLKNLVGGIGYLFQGLSLITKKGIRPFVIIPLVINIAVFSIAIWMAKTQFDTLMNKLLGWLPSWLSWVEWLFYPLFALLILVALYYVFTLVANLIAAPFNSLLAEKVELYLNGLPIPEFKGYKAMIKIVGKTMLSEFRKILYMIKWLPLLILISIIPVINIIAPFAWALYGSWMLALQYTDYPMGNHELFVKEELKRLRKHRASSLGFGGAMMLMTMIPVLNFLAIPTGVASGTAFWVDKLSKESKVA
jgi:CysZ protein